MRYIAFDLEGANLPLEEEELDLTVHDMGISIGATRTSGGVEQFWYSRTTAGLPAPRMSRIDVLGFLGYLEEMAGVGYLPLSWNGLSFDFQLLGKESGDWKLARKLSLNHYDPMFQVLCLRGHFLSMQKAAFGLEVKGKLEGMGGIEAVLCWQNKVFGKSMQYVREDTRALERIFLAIKDRERPGIPWQSNSGRVNFVHFPKGLYTVKECLDNIPRIRRPLQRRDASYKWWYDFAPDEHAADAILEALR